VTGFAAHGLNAADEIDVRTDQREIEPSAGADVPVAHLTVMQRDAGVQLGNGRGEPREIIQCAEGALERDGTGLRRIIPVEEGEGRVAHELEDFAAGAGDGRNDAIEISVEQLENARARQPVGELSEPAQIAE